jgi:hypothetical protein
MRQAMVAFKGLPRAPLARSVAMACFFALQGCAALSGKPDPELIAAHDRELGAAKAEVVSLKAEVEKLSAEKSGLETKVADLERRAARVAAIGEAALKDGPAPATTVAAAPIVDAPSTAPARPVVSLPNADVSLPDAPVPVDQSPRLVQPSFASTEQIFENEAASAEIKLTSVLWGVHLASYRHAEEASNGWKKLQRENPDELGLLEPRAEKISIEGKGEYLRLVGGGFSSREKAKALCDKLAAKGVFCRVANFGGDRLSMLDTGLR